MTLAIAVLALAAIVGGCTRTGGGTQPAPSGTSGGGSNAGPPAQTAQTGETVKVAGFELSVEQVQVATGPNLRDGHVYVALRATVRNNTKEPLVINSMNQFRVQPPSGAAVRVSLYAQRLNEPGIDAQLPAGERRTGWLGFEVPRQEGRYQLVFTPPSGEKVAFEFTLPR